MLYLVERQKNNKNIQSFLKYRGLKNSNFIDKLFGISFKTLSDDIAKIDINFNYNFYELKWNIDVRNCSLENWEYFHFYKYKKGFKVFKNLRVKLEFNWDINGKNIYPEMSYTYFIINLYPSNEIEETFINSKVYVIGWDWFKYGVGIVIKKFNKDLT
jgi:hypothetical protein